MPIDYVALLSRFENLAWSVSCGLRAAMTGLNSDNFDARYGEIQRVQDRARELHREIKSAYAEAARQ